MTWFRDPRGDFINVDGAKTGKVIDSRGGKRVELRDERGNPVAVIPEDALAPPDITIAGPLAACFIEPSGEVQWRAIVAWRVGRNGEAEPVIGGGTRPAGEMFVEFASSELLGMGRRFAGVKEAVKAVRDAAAEREFVQ